MEQVLLLIWPKSVGGLPHFSACPAQFDTLKWWKIQHAQVGEQLFGYSTLSSNRYENNF